MEGYWTNELRSAACEGELAAGNVVSYGTDPETQVSELAALPSADADAIMTASVLKSVTTAHTYAASVFDGAIGRDRISPARTISITFDANAGWDTGGDDLLIDIYGVDARGAEIKDTIAKATGSGAGTWKTAKAFAAVTRVDVGASGAATGTATMGVANDLVELGRGDVAGIAAYAPVKEPNSSTREFADEDEVSVLARGHIASVPEHDVSLGDDVYVRIAAAGTDLRGQLTGQDGADDPAHYARLVFARWASSGTHDTVQKVELF